MSRVILPRVIMRRCVHCRQSLPKECLIHVTYHRPGGPVTLFMPGEGFKKPASLQGRSAYVCQTADCLQSALRSQKLQKTLKCQIPGDIVKVLSEELEGLRSGDTV